MLIILLLLFALDLIPFEREVGIEKKKDLPFVYSLISNKIQHGLIFVKAYNKLTKSNEIRNNLKM